MTLKTMATAAILTLFPIISYAGGCIHSDQQAQSCAPGFTWDGAQQACVEQATS